MKFDIKDVNKHVNKDAAKAGLKNVQNKLFTAHSKTDERAWELVSTLPTLTPTLAYTCAALNVFFSGVGTMVASC